MSPEPVPIRPNLRLREEHGACPWCAVGLHEWCAATSAAPGTVYVLRRTVTTPRAWTLTIPLPVWTVNQSRNNHHYREAALVREYRGTTRMLARAAPIPHLDRIAIEATPFGPKIRQDTGAAYPALKAAIDGLVDAGVLDDDTPTFVPRVSLLAPRRGPHGLHLLIVDLADESPDWGCWTARLALDA